MPPTQYRFSGCACKGAGKQQCKDFDGATGSVCKDMPAMINITSPGAAPRAVPTSAFGAYTDLFLAGEAVRIIESHDAAYPLFLYLAFASPHDPLQVPAMYEARINTPAKSDSALAQACGATALQSRRILLGMVAAMDDGLGSVVQALQTNGNMWANTVLVFLSDNGGNQPWRSAKNYCVTGGWGMNYPLRGSKFSWFEGGIRTVAFIASPLLPGKVAGTQVNALVSISDWMLTLASLAKVPSSALPSVLDSVDYSSLITRGVLPSAPRSSIVLQYWTEARRYAAMVDVGGGRLFKIIQGWPAVGEYDGLMGPTTVSPRADVSQPPELPRALTDLSIVRFFLLRRFVASSRHAHAHTYAPRGC